MSHRSSAPPCLVESAERSRLHAGERGAAVSEFVLVSGLIVALFLGVIQLGLALHVRNTLISCASEGARRGARLGASPADGADRTRELIGKAISSRYAKDVVARQVRVEGVDMVEVSVSAPVPVVGYLGPSGRFNLTARAITELEPDN